MVAKEDIAKALSELREKSPKRKFIQSLEMIITLKELDMTKPENRLDEEVTLPNGIGKEVKVALIADGELAAQGKDAANRVITSEELASLAERKKDAKKLAKEYNYFLAQADLMPSVGKHLGPVLGPRGKMPKPVPQNAQIKPIIERLRRIMKLRTKDKPQLQVSVGSEDMKDEKLAENIETILTVVERKLDRGATNIRSIYLKTAMGPSVKVGR